MSKQAAPRKVGDKEALAVGNTIRGSARKLNLVAGLIRGRKVEEALNILKFSPKAMATDVRKVLASAVANAENNHNLDVDALVVVGSERRQVDLDEAVRDPCAWPFEPDRQAVQPHPRRRSRAGRSVTYGSEILSRRAPPADQPDLGQPLVCGRPGLRPSAAGRSEDPAATSFRRCRRPRSRRW